jgi:hypothetical protein
MKLNFFVLGLVSAFFDEGAKPVDIDQLGRDADTSIEAATQKCLEFYAKRGVGSWGEFVPIPTNFDSFIGLKIVVFGI